jgi:hypothetical protein
LESQRATGRVSERFRMRPSVLPDALPEPHLTHDAIGATRLAKVVFPDPEDPKPASPQLACDPPTLDGARVLIVDDEADARDLLRTVLEESGAVVMLAGSAEEALEVLMRGAT